jgi:FkbM family methyltransferase
MKGITDLARYFANHPLTKDAPVRAWGRFAAWQVRSRVQTEVVVPWIEGQRLAARRGMTGATGNIYAGLHEFYDMMLPLHFLRDTDLFLDIGANVGSFSVLAAGVCKAKVWAFEPDPVTASYLRRNLAINGLEPRVTVHELALGATEGEVRFTVGLDSVNKVLVESTAQPSRTVQMRTLDGLTAAVEPAMIKMDVEGHEADVLAGAEHLLSRPCLKVVEMETVSPAIGATMARHHFKQAYYEPFTRQLTMEPFGAATSNSVYVKDWDYVASRLATARKIHVLGRSI